MEKALHHGIVVAVTPAATTGPKDGAYLTPPAYYVTEVSTAGGKDQAESNDAYVKGALYASLFQVSPSVNILVIGYLLPLSLVKRLLLVKYSFKRGNRGAV